LGLYKEGKSKEVLEFLQRSWELNPVYDHGLLLHLEEVSTCISQDACHRFIGITTLIRLSSTLVHYLANLI
jgi:hypothetical protein